MNRWHHLLCRLPLLFFFLFLFLFLRRCQPETATADGRAGETEEHTHRHTHSHTHTHTHNNKKKSVQSANYQQISEKKGERDTNATRRRSNVMCHFLGCHSRGYSSILMAHWRATTKDSANSKKAEESEEADETEAAQNGTWKNRHSVAHFSSASHLKASIEWALLQLDLLDESRDVLRKRPVPGRFLNCFIHSGRRVLSPANWNQSNGVEYNNGFEFPFEWARG